jgi:hypothetical protein
MKFGDVNFLEPSGPLQACNGTDLPFLRPCCMTGYLAILRHSMAFIMGYILVHAPTHALILICRSAAISLSYLVLRARRSTISSALSRT